MSRAQEIADLLSGVTITTADNTSQLILKSTDADASAGPRLDLKRDSGSPADNDTVGRFRFLFDNDAAEETEAVRIDAFIPDVSDGTEDATFQTLTMVGGTMRSRVEHSSTETVFNQDSQDIDFRVEGNCDANLLFVDAGNDRIGIGTNSPSQLLSIHAESGSARMELISGTSGTSIIDMGDTSDADIGGIRYDNTNDALSFRAGNDERMNLDSGSLGIGVAASSASGRIHAEEPNNRNAAFIHATNASYGSSTLQVSTTRNTSNSSYNHLGCSVHGVQSVLLVRDSGNVVNVGDSYGSLSDQRMKENIVDATSQWDDIKAVRVRKFNMIGKSDTHIGVVAQELEAAGMSGLIDEGDWYDVTANPDNELRKSVKTSVLHMKAVKALQEAMTRIETLETQRADLEARLSALEAG